MTSTSFFFRKPSLVVQELIGFIRLVGDGQGRTVGVAERLIRPGEFERGWEKLTSTVFVHVDHPLGHYEGGRHVKAAELLEVAGPDFEQGVAVLLRREVQRGVATDDVSGILRGFGRSATRKAMLLLALLSDDRSNRCPPRVKKTLQPRPSWPMWMTRSIHSG